MVEVMILFDEKCVQLDCCAQNLMQSTAEEYELCLHIHYNLGKEDKIHYWFSSNVGQDTRIYSGQITSLLEYKPSWLLMENSQQI